MTRHFTRGAKRNDTMAARNGVFNTEELLEAILVELPALDLIRCQRVAKGWRATILASIAIRERLFIKPKDDFENWNLENGKIVATTDTPDLLDGKSFISMRTSTHAVVIATSSLNPFTISSRLPATTNIRLSGLPSSPGVFRLFEGISISNDFRPAINQLIHGKKLPHLEPMVLVNVPVTNAEVSLHLSADGWYRANFSFCIEKSGPLTVKDFIENVTNTTGVVFEHQTHGFAPDGRSLERSHSTNVMRFASVLQRMKEVSGCAPQVTHVLIRVFGLIFASEQDMEAVRKGEDLLKSGVSVLKKFTRT